MKAALVLKPHVLRSKELGAVISRVEGLGFSVIEIMTFSVRDDDLYEAYSLIGDYPGKAEVDSYRGGSTAVLYLTINDSISQEACQALSGYLKKHPHLFVKDNPEFLKFWFGRG